MLQSVYHLDPKLLVRLRLQQEFLLDAISLNGYPDGWLATERHNLHKPAPGLHALVVDLDEAVAGTDTGQLQRAAGINPANNVRITRHTAHPENRGQYRSQYDIHEGAG